MTKIRNRITGEIIEIPDQPGMQRVGPANTMRPLQEQGAQLGNRRAQQQIDAERQLVPLQVRKAQADALAAERSLSGKRTTPERYNELKDKMTALKNMEGSLTQLSKLYKDSFAGRNLAEYLPGTMRPENTQFDRLANQMGPYIMSILGMTGKATDAAAEYKQKVGPFIPNRHDPDEATTQTLGNLYDMLQRQKESTYKELGRPYRKVREPAPWLGGQGKGGSGNDGWKIEPIND